MAVKSVLQQISIVDVWAGQLPEGVMQQIAAGGVEPARFKKCFSEYPEVLVGIMRIAQFGAITGERPDQTLAYQAGAQDVARTIVTLSALEEKNAAEYTEEGI